MNVKYTKLFEIQFLHLYYNDRKCRDLRVVPTVATGRALAGHHLLCRATSNGLLVLAPVVGTAPARLRIPIPLDEGFKLRFRLESKLPYFLNFTELPVMRPEVNYLSPLRTGYYFSNLNAHSHSLSDPAQDLTLLSDPGESATTVKDRVIYLPPQFSFHFPSPTTSFTIKLNGGTVLNETITATEPFQQYQIDWRNLPTGVYTLQLDSWPGQTIFLDELTYRDPSFGIIEIEHQSLVEAAYRFATGGGETVQPNYQVYHLLFHNRFTTWRYVYNKAITNISVTTTSTAFTKNASARIFESQAALPLRETYRLVEQNDGGEVIRLPNPQPQMIRPDSNSSKIYSEIYL